jgi:hypothetical protein
MANRKSRPDLMRSLAGKWKTLYQKAPYLKSIAIGDGEPLRGIKNSKLEFAFPVTVLCGPNGTGKTTFLATSLLGFHAENPPIAAPKKSKYYEFKDFFISIPRDTLSAGICIEWTYTNGLADRITKGKQRWLRYIRNSGKPRRPLRGTEFVGISRITPAFEKRNYGTYFSRQKGISESDASDIQEYLSRILKRPYSSLKELEFNNSSGSFKARHYNGRHSSFNAGAGEECLFGILRALLSSPEGSFIAIEEIEIGLHPSTLGELFDCILEIADLRKLQLLITSHSPDFLRSCPKETLVLAERADDQVTFMPEPNVEYAIRRLGGSSNAQVRVICEDEFAKHIIENCLPARLRDIAPVVGFGGKEQLVERAKFLAKAVPDAKIMIAWDGEVDVKLLKDAQEAGFLGVLLPGECEPEQFVLEALISDEGKEWLVKNYRISAGEFESLKAATSSTTDVHDLPYVICTHLRISSENELMPLVRQAVNMREKELSFLVEHIDNIASLSRSDFDAYLAASGETAEQN